MNKKWLLILIIALGIADVYAQKPKLQGDWNQLFAGPQEKPLRDHWMQELKEWRRDEKKRVNYSDSEYNRKELKWTRSNFVFLQAMSHDRFLYDPESGKYTVDKFLDDITGRYGGIEGILIWPTYPNIGVDSRNQYDYFAGMPGGKEGLRSMVKDFHKRGVKVFIPIMFWDYGTRPVNDSMHVALMKELKEIGADGLTGDTMFGVPVEYKNAYDSLDYPVALQPELTVYDYKMLEWNTLSWNYYWPYTQVPGVSIYKWLEPKHQVHVTNRWAVDKTNDLQYAFFNGIGYNPWENIWGIWNQIPDRYEEAIRRIFSIYRKFPDVWSGEDWEPHFPTVQDGVYASRFSNDGFTVYNFVNRGKDSVRGQQIVLPYNPGFVYYDIWNGKRLEPQRTGDQVNLNFGIEGSGFGSILEIPERKKIKSLKRFLKEMELMSRTALKSISDEWKPLQQEIVKIEPASVANRVIRSRELPDDEMILIPAARDYYFETDGVMIEGDELPTAIGIQYPWHTHPNRSQYHTLDIPAFYMDKYPVTNRQFKVFLDETHYHPADDHNFLKDWHKGNYPEGWDRKPVTWISIEDARAFAEWAGKRLPNEWEWQYAAQGKDGLRYPWGNEMDGSRIPPIDSSRNLRSPSDVDAFPAGASSAGVSDLMGNVWQWTNEYRDEYTRFAVLKGGSYYRPKTSDWYFPAIQGVNKYGKYLLMSPGLDRSATIGFRCVKDIPVAEN